MKTSAGRLIDVFESVICSRCWGSGNYSHTSEWGYTCFKCGFAKHVPGTGFVLSKLGSDAYEAYRAANTDNVPVTDIAVGDLIRISGRLTRVTAIEHGDFGWSRSTIEGVSTRTDYTIMLHTKDGYDRSMAVDDMVDRWTQRVDLPPVMTPGTNRQVEMKAYIASSLASKLKAAS